MSGGSLGNVVLEGLLMRIAHARKMNNKTSENASEDPDFVCDYPEEHPDNDTFRANEVVLNMKMNLINGCANVVANTKDDAHRGHVRRGIVDVVDVAGRVDLEHVPERHAVELDLLLAPLLLWVEVQRDVGEPVERGLEARIKADEVTMKSPVALGEGHHWHGGGDVMQQSNSGCGGARTAVSGIGRSRDWITSMWSGRPETFSGSNTTGSGWEVASPGIIILRSERAEERGGLGGGYYSIKGVVIEEGRVLRQGRHAPAQLTVDARIDGDGASTQKRSRADT
uniref:Uncharacterized protein n=2 Tax=Leersia perrieri TaxID=77586 RepID=A0A0D9V8U2_9ORYZ